MRRRFLAGLTGLAFLACSQDRVADPEVTAESVAPEAGGEFSIVKTPAYEFSASIATDGTNFLVSYLSTSTVIVKARTVSAGAVLGPQLSTGRLGDWPLLAFDGTNYLMVWRDIQDVAQPNLRGLFVSTTGAKVGAMFAITGSDDISALNGLAFGGGQYLVTFKRQDGLLYRRFISPAGALGTVRLVSAQTGESIIFSNLATDGTDFLAVWVGGSNGQSTMARLILGDGSLGPLVTVSQTAAETAVAPGVAFNGGQYLAVWQDEVAANEEAVYGRLVTAAGVVNGGRIRIAGSSGVHRTSGRVVPSGANFAVEYIEGSNTNQTIKLRFVDAAGAVTGSEKTLFTYQNGKRPYLGPILANGSAFFLVVNRLELDYDVRGKFQTLTP